MLLPAPAGAGLLSRPAPQPRTQQQQQQPRRAAPLAAAAAAHSQDLAGGVGIVRCAGQRLPRQRVRSSVAPAAQPHQPLTSGWGSSRASSSSASSSSVSSSSASSSSSSTSSSGQLCWHAGGGARLPRRCSLHCRAAGEQASVGTSNGSSSGGSSSSSSSSGSSSSSFGNGSSHASGNGSPSTSVDGSGLAAEPPPALVSAAAAAALDASAAAAAPAAAEGAAVAVAVAEPPGSALGSGSLPPATSVTAADEEDMCRVVDELDTPEGLTDVQYAPSSAAAADEQRRIGGSSYTPGTWQGDDEDDDAAGGAAALWRNRDDLLTLGYAVAMGGLVATSVFFFDVSIQYVHDLPDIFSQDLHLGGGRATGLVIGGTAIPFRCIMPIGAGLIVAYLQRWGFSPALKFLTRAIEGVVDDTKHAALPTSYWQVFRRAAASVITLGSGASLGPEAPSVELGANTAAVFAPKHLSKRRQRMLVAAGAAAGVSAAFDAPATGALFAIEFVLKSSRLGLDRLSTSTVFASTSVAAGVIGFLRSQGQALGITGAATHLVGRIPYFSINPNLLTDVLQFSVLGVGCAGAAVLLYEGIRVSEVILRPLPRWASAPLGGALCGIIAFKFPQVQYGYINLEEIFRDSTRLSAVDLSSLLLAKIAATSVCVGGGLVGGLFAPSLFIGALVGDVMGHFVANRWGVADPTTLVVVGAAAVLGAACRAPLTAFGLMVEITRDTGLFVPLLAAVGVASLVSEYAEGIFSQQFEEALTSIYLREKFWFWGAWGGGAGAGAGSPGGGSPVSAALQLLPGSDAAPSRGASPAPGAGAGVAAALRPAPAKTVESVIATRAALYVRHTLPLEQARDALLARASAAAVVVDDNFTPMGVVYLADIEAELVKTELLLEPDANFDRPPN